MIHPVDIHVGARLRAFRKEARMSQETLAGHLGVTFQQVQKYERGTNRISASKLFEAAELLRMPIALFFEGLEGGQGGAKDPLLASVASDPELRRLIRLYLSQPSEQARRRILEAVEIITRPV
jgi:transcriptional regulator with XRE-family HTH domain